MKIKIVGLNQIIVMFSDMSEVFYSYNTPVCLYVPDHGYYKTSAYYSQTTSKHINAYLGSNPYKTIPANWLNALLAQITLPDIIKF